MANLLAWSTRRLDKFSTWYPDMSSGSLLFEGVASSWLFIDDRIGAGKVLDRSQISTSFLILGYKKNLSVLVMHVVLHLVRDVHSERI